MKTQFSIEQTKEERERLEVALEKSGCRTKSELIRYLVNIYLKEIEDERI